MVGLVTQWPRVTDWVEYPHTGSRPRRWKWATHLHSHTGVWYRLCSTLPNYIACWQRYKEVSNLPVVLM